jgi:C1A family cysteine protease
VRRSARACLLLAVALASLAALSAGLSAGASPDAATGAPPGEAGETATSAASAAAAPWETAGPFPSAFDLRTAGRVTPVRSQDSFSTCWIMAATGSLESVAVTTEGRMLDFSENNLANHMATRLDYEGRAPSELAAAYYARWEGPVWETSDPYPRPGKSPPYLRAVRHVQEMLFLPRRRGPLDNDAVKWAVVTHGGVDAAADFRVQEEHGFWNAETNSYFSDTPGDLNHHILAVGWDDSYPASNFLAGTRPPGDGAFLIKNSWGTDFADRGYLWVSYYDASFGKALAVFTGVASRDDFDAIYQYDALGRSAWLSADGSEQAWYANRFTNAGSGTVAAVSFYTPVPGTAYEVRVAPTLQGIAAAPVAASGTVAVGGYHTIRLQREAAVTAGDRFVVAVRATTPDWTEPVPVEAPSRYIAPRARAGQSFVSADGSSWTDLTSLTALPGLSRANVCLKAFVESSGAADTRPPRVDIRGGVVRRGDKAMIRWRLEDPAFSSGSAIITLSVRNAAGKVVASRRIPAVAVGERGVWSLTANWPQGRYSVRGRAYDVAGRRQATASRAAVLVRGIAPAAAAPLLSKR